MNSMRKVALACMTAAMVTISVNASAQAPANQDTFFTFSQAVELPGTTLPAGRYFFQLMDSPSNRHIVKVMSEDRTKLHTTLMAIPYYSTDRPSDKPEVRFMEVPAAENVAASNAIKIWFYPGNTVGHEFIWPRDKAMSLARSTGQPVLTTKGADENSELSRVSGDGIDAVVTDNQAQAQTQDPAATATVAQSEPAAQREPVGAITGNDAARAPATERTELPNTAGALPLLALIGLGSLIGSRLMRRSRQ